MKLLHVNLLLPFITLMTFNSVNSISAQSKSDDGFLGKARMYKAKKTALDFLSAPSTVEKFGNISDSIWNFAELGLREFRSSAILIKALEGEGFAVEKGVAGMPTCFVATWGNGKPVIGFLGEYDALPGLSQKALIPKNDPLVIGGPGHGCGHNMMGTAGVATAIAIKKSMEANNITGTVKFFGSPAEETIGGKLFMVRDGVFQDVDAVIDNHSGTGLGTYYGIRGNANIGAIFTFKGKTAHSASAPWAGRSALDAVEIMNVATNYLREHLFYTYRMHYVITAGGDAPNVVPDRASVWYYIRNTDEMIEDMYQRVVDCAKGAAIATGTILDTIKIMVGIHQRHANKSLAEVIQKNIELIGIPDWNEDENNFAKSLQKELGARETGFETEVRPLTESQTIQVGGASSDVGEVTVTVPTATVTFPGTVPGTIGHNWGDVASGYGSASWKGFIAGAKVMAGSAIDLLTNPKILEGIKIEFSDYSKDHPYKSFLPENVKPSLDLFR